MNTWEYVDQENKLRYDWRDKADVFERERKENIKQRYALLVTALLNTREKAEIKILAERIAEIGVEFEACKATAYLGGEPFDTKSINLEEAKTK